MVFCGELRDEAFRQRILLKQNAVSTTGTEASYIAVAKASDADVADVQVPDLDEEYRVVIYVVKAGGGLFTNVELAAIQAACGADDVKPLGDLVVVQNAARVEYEIEVEYTCSAEDEAAVVAAIEGDSGAIDAYKEWQDETIARAINPQKLMALMFAAGAQTVEVTKLTATAVTTGHVANCTSVDATHEAV